MNAPTTLRIEHLGETLGIGVREPRLSWRLPPGAREQSGYELRDDDGRHVVVAGDANTLVSWPFPPLTSAERRVVSVRVTTDLGLSDWSEPLPVEAGLLEPQDWAAHWIGVTAEPTAAPHRPAYLLRGAFEVDGDVQRARLYATAQGIVEPWLDGVRVGDEELLPGFTEYAHHNIVRTWDVTGHLAPGRHRLGAILADGWYRGQVGITRAGNQWGERTALLMQLVVTYADGTVSRYGTDPSWQWKQSHIEQADLIEGQVEDRRTFDATWCRSDSPGWQSVSIEDRGFDTLVSSPAPPVRAVEKIRPVAVRELSPGLHIVDLGQNINGRIRLDRLGPTGTEVTLTYGEALGPDGDVTIEHLRPAMPFLPEPLSAGQVDRVVSAGVDGDGFDPRFTTHGFQYVRVTGVSRLAETDLTGVVVHTDLTPTGGFDCSDDRVNRLHESAVWSFRDNACDIPTDCPTRERAGWTGDWQLFVPTASYLYDVAGFSVKWLRDLTAEQWPDGNLGNMAPMPVAERTGMLEKMNGSAGWGDAVVLVPWELYQEYGDAAQLREFWPAMVRWLDRAERMATTGRHPDRIALNPEPLPHEKYLWDTGFHWGEWLEPDGHPTDFPAFVAADKADVATAFYAWSTRHAAAIAELIGERAAADRYRQLSERIVTAWRSEFIDTAGRVNPHTQANLVRALRFGLVPDELRQQTTDDLAALVTASGGHLGTGFLATPDLLPVLADHGYSDLAFELLFQSSPPSWLAMIDRGATTLWEHWEGIDDDGLPHESLNHYSKGAVISFLHRYVAGLQRVEPTWRRFTVQPHPGGRISSAHTWHDSSHGRIEVSWQQAADGLHTRVTVPAGCSAQVGLPGVDPVTIGPGEHSLVL